MARDKRGIQDRSARQRGRAERDKAEAEAREARDAAKEQERARTEEQATERESSRVAIQESVAVKPSLRGDDADDGPKLDHDGPGQFDDGPVGDLKGEVNNLDAFEAKGLPGTTGDIDTGGGVAGQLADAQGAGQALLDSVMGGVDSLRGGLTRGGLGDSNAMSGGELSSDSDNVLSFMRDFNAGRVGAKQETYGQWASDKDIGTFADRQATGQDNGSMPGTQEFADSVAADPTTTATEAEASEAAQLQGEDPLETETTTDAGTTDTNTTGGTVTDDTVASTGDGGSGTGDAGSGGVPQNARVDALLGRPDFIAVQPVDADAIHRRGDPAEGGVEAPEDVAAPGGMVNPHGGAIDPVDDDGTGRDFGVDSAIDYAGPSASDPLDEIGGAGIDGLGGTEVPGMDTGGGGGGGGDGTPEDDGIPD